MTDSHSAPIWVDKPALLLEAARLFLAQGSVSVDTESNSLHAYREQVCLIQFSIPENDFLIDPLALDDLSPLAEVFESKRIEKIFHAAEYDVICLKRDYGFTFNNLFDTMVAARILGVREIGLNNLLATEFDVLVDKKLQKADWGKRPLPEEYREYARNDTHYLKQLRDVLYGRLCEKDLLELANEDFKRMTRSTGSEPSTVEEQLWHVNGARDLTSRQAAILLELMRWREQKARDLNRPPFKVISSEELLEIAFTQANTIHALKQHAHVSERLTDRFGAELIHMVEVGQKRPPIRPPVNGKCDPVMRARIDRLKEFRKKAAGSMEVESDIILPKELLYQLAENPPAGWQEFEQAMALYPWRLAHYGNELFKAIHPLHESRCL